MNYTEQYIEEAVQILNELDPAVLERVVDLLVDLRGRGGRLFFLGPAAAPGTPRMLSVISARSPRSKPIPLRTMCLS